MRASLVHQLGSFVCRHDDYVSLDQNMATASVPHSGCSALDVRSIYGGELPAVTKALLSIIASEAAVERSLCA